LVQTAQQVKAFAENTVEKSKTVVSEVRGRLTGESKDLGIASQGGFVERSVPAKLSGADDLAVRKQIIENNIAADDAPFGLARDTKALIADRKALAESFYKESGFNESRTMDHMRGIDFNQPVAIADISKGTEAIQYQIPRAPLGDYFSPPGTPGNRLGFYTSGREATSYIATENIKALQSTAASTVDDWSMKQYGWRIEAPGGGTQFFSTSKAWTPK
jgi:hypothetical protein